MLLPACVVAIDGVHSGLCFLFLIFEVFLVLFFHKHLLRLLNRLEIFVSRWNVWIPLFPSYLMLNLLHTLLLSVKSYLF